MTPATETVPLVPRQTTRWAQWIYGGGGDVPLDDPAESYHEASKVSPRAIGRQIQGARRLEGSPDLQISATRAVKRSLHLPTVPLPPPALPEVPLREAIERRRSERAFADSPIAAAELSTLLHAAYGVTGVLRAPSGEARQPLRAVPSGGALYPLEVYVAALRVEGLEPGLYHYDPLRPALEIVRLGESAERVADLSTYPEIVTASGAVLILTAMFWRTRFKYGLRGYRFALLEAGHVVQNVVLAATGLGLAEVPLGGYYDRLTDDFLGIDGANESTLYLLSAGRGREGEA